MVIIPISVTTDHTNTAVSVHTGMLVQTARELQTFEVPTFPDIVCYISGTLQASHLSQVTHRHVLVSVHAGNQTAKELQAFAVATFPDIVSRISGSTVDKVFGSTMTHPKVVLFTDKEETPGVFRALAASFRKYQLLFFTIHSSDAHARKTFSVEKVS